MTPERWEEIGNLYERALSCPAEQRAALLDQACTDDPALRQEVESMLAVYEADPDFLEQPALPIIEQAGAILADDFRLDPATHAGPYRLIRPLGRGGMGEVFLAVRDLGAVQQTVALKLLRPALEHEDLVHRFSIEQQILAQLAHPSIARLLDAGQTEHGRPYLVMEYVDGEPITTYCDRHRLTVEQRLRLFTQVCEAVHFAHQHLVIHRDLKPSNILVTAPPPGRAEERQVKLLDFGIAKMLDPVALDMSSLQTRTGQRLLTPAYASPEQIEGAPLATTSDVYSLGVLLYELLTGKRPYALDGKTESEVARIIAEQTPVRPSTAVRPPAASGDKNSQTAGLEAVSTARSSSLDRLQRRLKGDLDTIALKTLRKEPQRRYESADALAEDVRRYLAELPVKARPDTAGYRMRKFVRRHWAGVVVAAAFVLLLAGFATAMTLQQAETAQQRDRAELQLATSETVTNFLLDLFEANRPSEARGDTITARELLERGLAQIKTLQEQPEVQTRMLDLVGRIYRSLGEYDKATPLVEKALADRRLLFGDTHVDVATSLYNLAGLRTDQGQFEEATRLAEEALTLHRAVLGDEHSAVADNLRLLATLENHQGHYDEAAQRFRDLLAVERSLYGTDDLRVAQTLHNFARLLDAKADYETSVTHLREALAIYRQAHESSHPEVIVIMNTLGLALSRTGQHEEAVHLLNEVVALRRRVLGPAHPGLATSLNTLAVALNAQGKPMEAVEHLGEASTIYRNALGDEHPNVATTVYNMARLLHQAGQLDAAEANYREALAMRRKLLGDDHPRVALNAAFLGQLLHERGAYAEAEPLYLDALATMRSRLGDDHDWTLDTQQRLVELYEAWGKPDRADAYRPLPSVESPAPPQ